ncbi:Uu.00g025670.m01.CDS01 [Anthostomella pinea]|uniref:Uu.00g025670.m01.CDS01 n=1 Tax=Anthostomella pinea TaxID=933095 RepID=A0AAI8V7C8_9PEZI|nr:Uu.00g025670.m01.CDS01 [Anthostomella pinea]
MASAQVCPVVGTTNSTLPPTHPEVDLSKPGQTCPVVGAKTDHHHNLSKHPSVPSDSTASSTTKSTGSADAQACPALKSVVNQAKSKEMDDKVCPVVGPVTTVLPPDHPSTEGQADGAECPVTKAKVGHHKDKVVTHPAVKGATGACPVTGATQA